jgi:hypothetical protein
MRPDWLKGRVTQGVLPMTTKSKVPNDTEKHAKNSHPGMMGDGTEEQNLNQPGNPAARIKKEDADAAFGHKDRQAK